MRRVAAAIAVAALTVLGTPLADAKNGSDKLTATSVDLAVLQVTPSTPPQSSTPYPLNITLLVTNTTDQSLTNVRIDVLRGDPIDNRRALDAAIARPAPPSPDLEGTVTPLTKVVSVAHLGPRGQTQLVFPTNSEIPNEAGLCLCHNAIYPLYITAHVVDASGADVQVGVTQTYVPSFKDQSYQQVQVSWVWPILDRPHRLAGDGTFLDDQLASLVTSDGRLDRVLQVAERTASTVPLTLIIDPELVDELAVMATGPYHVTSGKQTIDGVGTSAAAAYLTRLRALLAQPGVTFSFTPFADPDVESLTRNGLTWSTNLGHDAQVRVADALGGRSPTDDIAWPVDEAVSDDTLATIARQGATGVILNDAALPAQRGDLIPPSYANLQTTAGPVNAYIPAQDIERFVSPVVSLGGPGLRELPQLVAEVAVHAVQPGAVTPYVVLTPPRFVNPNPTVAAAAIRATAHTFWSTPVSLADAGEHVTPSNRAGLIPPQQPVGLSPQTISAATTLTRLVPALKTMLSSTDANALLGALPAAVQRAESNGWRTAVEAGNAFAQSLTSQIEALQSGVKIIKPSSGTYTLTSSNSPLPITVENRLNVAVTVRVRLTTVNGVPGFHADDVVVHNLAPGSKIPLRIPTHAERTGRFDVQAVLLTPSNEQIGVPVVLSVRSTALGLIGVLITAVAGGVLALALLIRFVRLWRRRAARPATPGPVITE